MADMASIIAGIDGYRRYEQNRALDLNNQAQALQNAQAGKIMDLKSQLEALQTNPYAKYNIWDPVGRRQQLLSEDDQLKIASKWASSIKNLAPENREAGYKQFLRAMPGLGIDVSDMPQGYDEGYINMIADLGIGTETRYQNEQQNSRLERQIEANREARQDEFNKRLAELDYRQNLDDRNLQRKIDYINGTDFSDAQKRQAIAGLYGIKYDLENPKTPIDAMTSEYLDPATSAERRQEILPEIQAYREREKQLSGLLPQEPKKYATGDLGLVQYMTDNGIEQEEALRRVGKMTPEEKISFEAQKAQVVEDAKTPNMVIGKNIDYDNNVRLENQKQAGRREIAAINQENKLAEMNYQNMLNMNAEAYKATLPTQKMREIKEQSQVTGIPVDEIVKQDLAEKRLEAQNKMIEGQQKLLQMQYQQAQIEKTQKETDFIGQSKPTNEIQNYEYVQKHPEAANSSFFKEATKKDKGEADLRKEFNQLTKDYRTIGDSYSRILKAADKPSAAGDLSLIFNYMKMLDPNSVVRESEFSNAENARAWFSETGAPTAVALAYEKARTGQRLLPQQRADFVNMAGNLMKAQQASFMATAKQFRRLAAEGGYNPDNVVFDPYASLSKENDNQADYNFADTSDDDLLVLGE